MIEKLTPGRTWWQPTKRRILTGSAVLVLLVTIVLLWLTIDEPLNDLTKSWLESTSPLDEESFQLLVRFANTQQYRRGYLSYEDFTAEQNNLIDQCNFDFSICILMALNEPERIAPLVPDNPEYWRLYEEIETRSFGSLVDGQQIPPFASLIEPVSNRLLRDLLDHGKIDHERLLAGIRANRQQLIDSSSLIMAMVFTATLQRRLNHLDALLRTEKSRTPELLELTGFEDVLVPIGTDESQRIGWFRDDFQLGYDLFFGETYTDDPFFKRNVYLNRQVQLLDYLENFLKLPDEEFWAQSPSFPGYSLADKIVDPLGLWDVATPAYAGYLTVFGISNQLLQLSLARQRIYQGASPLSHGVSSAAGWEWQWKSEINELCLVPVAVHPDHKIDYPLCSTINRSDLVSRQDALAIPPSAVDPG